MVIHVVEDVRKDRMYHDAHFWYMIAAPAGGRSLGRTFTMAERSLVVGIPHHSTFGEAAGAGVEFRPAARVPRRERREWPHPVVLQALSSLDDSL